jgi:uncharacterized membrane protein SpoIIM required for sporulation
MAQWFALLIFVSALIFGFVVGLQPEWRLPLPETFAISDTASNFRNFFNIPTETGLLTFIFWQNTRVLLGTTLLALFTFGIGGLFIAPTFVILGYIVAQIIQAGWDPMIIAVTILPHGIVEIPIIWLATSAAVRLGASITRPPAGMAVGQSWLLALGDTIKIWVGVILPGLAIAALLEAYLTPALVGAILGGG